MKLQFNSKLDYQIDAINSVVDIFKGQSKVISNFTLPKKTDEVGTPAFNEDIGIGNKLELYEEDILNNVRNIQLKNGLALSKNINKNDYNFDIEMETGTGKTYVFLRTIFELNVKYDFKKFIIVVPSVAIKEGIVKSIKIMENHFKGLYNINIKSSEYKAKSITTLESFATSNNAEIMIMTVQSFNKDTNVINIENEKTYGLKPLQIIKQTNPIVIIDEPQSTMGGKKGEISIKSLNPLFTLRYSATHKETKNLIFKLDAIDAYQRKLVKQIEVASVVPKDNNNLAYLKLISVDNKKSPITAKIEIDELSKGGKIKRTVVTVKVADDLYDYSGKRELYEGYVISEIFVGEGKEFVSFTTKPSIKLGEVYGELDDDTAKRSQIRKTIEEHLNKELKLNKQNIKVLSLFFVDNVSNYRTYDENKNPKKGKYALWFEEEYKKLIKLDKYKVLFKDIDIETEVEQIHNGYFSQDKKGILKNTKGNTLDDEDAYSLIMKDKERLLSFDTKLRFIFSHSALREGWDNPNVFQICTLNETKSEVKKRQEIGRGLRLAVNQDGERVFGFDVNTLTVMVNESYERFAECLQKEYEEDSNLKFGVVEKNTFSNLVICKDGQSKYIEQDGSKQIWEYLKNEEYIDSKGKITDNFKIALKEESFELPEEFKEVKVQVVNILKKLCGKLNIKNADEKVKIKLNKQRFLSPEFKELWDKIKYKTTFSVEFDSDELIKVCVKEIRETVSISKIKQVYSKANLDYTVSGIIAEQSDRYSEDIETVKFRLPDIITYLQNETELTRRSIVKILNQTDKLQDFKNNPQKFMDEVSEIIKRKLKHFIIDGIKYKKIGEQEYYSQELFENEELYGYISKNILETEKSVYESVVYDSDVEYKFAQGMEKNERVKVYAKLPKWFTIDTPIGKYNPDWAVFIEKNNEEKLYFVFETKGSIVAEDLRVKEEDKIRCAKKHFEALDTNVVFKETDGFNKIIEEI